MQRGLLLKLMASCILAGLAACIASGCGSDSGAAERKSDRARLQELEDREAIRQLTMDYGRFLDQRDWAAFSELFAEKEGEWSGGMGSAKGPKAIRKLMEDTIGKDSGTMSSPNYHIFTNQTVNVDGDRATAATKWMFVVQGRDNRPEAIYLGHYDDSLVRENGRWKFLRRIVYADIPSDKK